MVFAGDANFLEEPEKPISKVEVFFMVGFEHIPEDPQESRNIKGRMLFHNLIYLHKVFFCEPLDNFFASELGHERMFGHLNDLLPILVFFTITDAHMFYFSYNNNKTTIGSVQTHAVVPNLHVLLLPVLLQLQQLRWL